MVSIGIARHVVQDVYTSFNLRISASVPLAKTLQKRDSIPLSNHSQFVAIRIDLIEPKNSRLEVS